MRRCDGWQWPAVVLYKKEDEYCKKARESNSPHSLALEPTIWKHCCAIFTYSRCTQEAGRVRGTVTKRGARARAHRGLLLADDRIHDALEDVLGGRDGLHVLYQLVRLFDVVCHANIKRFTLHRSHSLLLTHSLAHTRTLSQVVDDEVETRLGDHVHQRHEGLQRAVAIAEHDQIVPDEVLSEHERRTNELL